MDGYYCVSCRYPRTLPASTIVFRRCFYRASSLDEFPEHMRDCLRVGARGEFYEDFYRVVVQVKRATLS